MIASESIWFATVSSAEDKLESNEATGQTLVWIQRILFVVTRVEQAFRPAVKSKKAVWL
jgi:hypothetical protein